jgi:ABC-2 type transport system permease protein
MDAEKSTWRERWRVIRAIVGKDMVETVKNQWIFMGLVLPVLMSLFFRLVFPSEVEATGLVVALHDPGRSRLAASLEQLPDLTIRAVGSEAEVTAAIEEDELAGGLVIPAGFDEDMTAGHRPAVIVYLNRQVGNRVESVRLQLVLSEQIWSLAGQSPPADLLWRETDLPADGSVQLPLNVENFLFILLLVLALTMAGMMAIPILLVEEKEKRTLDVLLLSPAGPAEIVASKAITGLIYSLTVAGLIVALNRGWVGNWPVTAVTVVLGAFFMIAAGLLLGSLLRTMMQVNTWVTVLMLVLMIPGWGSLAELPSAAQTVLHLLPTYYLADTLQQALAGEATFARVGTNLVVLAGSTILTFAAVIWTLRPRDT